MLLTTKQKKSFILGVGCQKCGTSWLHQYLKLSGKFNGGTLKEYHIWDALDVPALSENLVAPPTLSGYAPEPSAEVRYRMQNEQDFYFDYFDHLLTKKYSITGDITPAYSALDAKRLRTIANQFAAKNIDSKAVLLIRNPVDRIASAVRFNLARANYREGINEGETDFARAMEQYYASVHCQIRTRYDVIAENLGKSFAPESIYIGIFESMFEKSEIGRLSEFLGVSARSEFGGKRVNVTPGESKLDSAMEAFIRSEYHEVYEYCHDRFPETRHLWRIRK